MLSCHFIAVLWSPAGKALVGDVYCTVVTFPCGILGQVWFLIVSFPGLYRLSYFLLKAYKKCCYTVTITGKLQIIKPVQNCIGFI